MNRSGKTRRAGLERYRENQREVFRVAVLSAVLSGVGLFGLVTWAL